jgi:hypothetical protein
VQRSLSIKELESKFAKGKTLEALCEYAMFQDIEALCNAILI